MEEFKRENHVRMKKNKERKFSIGGEKGATKNEKREGERIRLEKRHGEKERDQEKKRDEEKK